MVRMRDIKFRAFDLDEKKMKTVNSIDFTNELITVYDKESLEHVLSFSDVDLMQYTGLKDINNVEIFEGDIVEVSKERINFKDTTIVKFDKGSASFVLVSQDNDNGYLSYDISYYNYNEVYYRVLGNIYENKELLEQENK